jgi:hypothetical protein
MTELKQAMEQALEAGERMAFEAHMKDKLGQRPTPDGGGSYAVTECRWAWEAWQARAALSSLPDVQTGLSDEQIMRHGYAAIRSDRPIPKEADTWEFYDDELIDFARDVLSAAYAPKEPQQTDGVETSDKRTDDAT